MRKFLAVAALAAATLSACGGGSSSGSTLAKVDAAKLTGADKEAYDQVLESMADDSDGMLGDDAEQQACVAGQLLKKAGATETLAIAKKDGENLTKPQAEKVVDAVSACVDLSEMFVQGMTDGSEISEKSAKCFGKEFDSGKLRDFMVTAFMAGEDDEPPAEFIAEAMKVVTKCFTPEEMASLGG
jgi:hypothetical protein